MKKIFMISFFVLGLLFSSSQTFANSKIQLRWNPNFIEKVSKINEYFAFLENTEPDQSSNLALITEFELINVVPTSYDEEKPIKKSERKMVENTLDYLFEFVDVKVNDQPAFLPELSDNTLIQVYNAVTKKIINKLTKRDDFYPEK